MHIAPQPQTDSLSRKIIGAAIQVHKTLGPGFLESIYEASLCVELDRRRIPIERQRIVPIVYCDVEVGEHRLDVVVDDTIVVELKACKGIEPVHYATLRSYLQATGLPRGLLINFSDVRLDFRSVRLTQDHS